MTYKTYDHNPPHLFAPNCIYFVTGSTYNGIKYLSNFMAKRKVLEYIRKTLALSLWELIDWVILDNHYHILIMSSDEESELSTIFEKIHKFSANWIVKNTVLTKSHKKIWHNYWDSCITNEKSYYARMNYIWQNPVKHGYVADAGDWEFGSYYTRVREEEAKINEIRKKYPCNLLRIKDDF